jgi:hypothetical protein
MLKKCKNSILILGDSRSNIPTLFGNPNIYILILDKNHIKTNDLHFTFIALG